MGETPPVRAMLGNQVVARIGGTVASHPVTHLEVRRSSIAVIDEAVGGALMREADAVTGSHNGLTGVVDEGDLSGNHEDKFVLQGVPVKQRRGSTRLKCDQIDPEGGDAESISKHPLHPTRHAGGEGLGIN